MKLPVTLSLTLLSFVVYCQTTEEDLVSIVKNGVATKKFPTEIINKGVDTLRLPPTIAIECTAENGLKQYVSSQLDSIQIHTWDVKYMFLYDYYWMTPSNIRGTADKVTFDFVTHTFTRKQTRYYKGQVTAKKINGSWDITKIRKKETEYSYDEVKRAARK